jgi:hypothetical protein
MNVQQVQDVCFPLKRAKKPPKLACSINNLLDEKVLPLFIVAYSSSRMQSFVETEELSSRI